MNPGSLLITNARVVNEGHITEADLLIKNGIISQIAPCGTLTVASENTTVKDLNGLLLLPGVIDDQVHFREPGLTHKAEIATESAAAVAGGITSFMEMPNTTPQTTTYDAFLHKLKIASAVSPANYSFFFGATNSNLEDVLRLNDPRVCGVKVFMGSSTGDMLVDNQKVLEALFSSCNRLIATHCEDEQTIRKNSQWALNQYGTSYSVTLHPKIRSREACYLSSSQAIALAQKHQTRLHILHISTAEEVALFKSGPINSKHITSEACVHHLWFSDQDYNELGTLIQCNPAIKTAQDRDAIWKALQNNQIDIIATDHAPHTWEEKHNGYPNTPGGLPLVQFSLPMMMHKAPEYGLGPEWVVEKMCHAPARCFNLQNRGFIREGYFADLVVFDPNAMHSVSKNELLYKCKWSPLEGQTLKGKVIQTLVNGQTVYENGRLTGIKAGQALTFGPQN